MNCGYDWRYQQSSRLRTHETQTTAKLTVNEALWLLQWRSWLSLSTVVLTI